MFAVSLFLCRLFIFQQIVSFNICCFLCIVQICCVFLYSQTFFYQFYLFFVSQSGPSFSRGSFLYQLHLWLSKARAEQRARCNDVVSPSPPPSSAPPPLHLQWVTATRPLHSFLGFSHFLRQIFAKVVLSFTKNGGVNISYIVTVPNKIKLIRVTNVSGHIFSKR